MIFRIFLFDDLKKISEDYQRVNLR